MKILNSQFSISLLQAAQPHTQIAQGTLDPGDLGAQILEGTPPVARPFVEPLIPGIVDAIHQSFAIAISSTFWICIAAALLAAVLVLFLKEVPARAAAPAEAPSPAS